MKTEKQSTYVFLSLHPSRLDSCGADVSFIRGHGPEMKRVWWLSDGNAEQSSEPIWASGAVCGNDRLHLPAIIFRRTLNRDTPQVTSGSPLMKLGANMKCVDTRNGP